MEVGRNSNDGCTWEGELRNIEAHQCECCHSAKQRLSSKQSQNSKDEAGATSTDLLKEIIARLERCEESLLEKENDLAYLKFNLKETKDRLADRDEEVQHLKQKLLHAEEIQKLRDKDLENLKNEVHELKDKICQYENESTLRKQEIGDVRFSNNKMENMRTEVTGGRKKDIESLDGISLNKLEELAIAGRLERKHTEVTGGRKKDIESLDGVSLNKLEKLAIAGRLERKHTFEWKTNMKEWQYMKYTDSPMFYCHTNGLQCHLSIFMNSFRCMQLHFQPESVDGFGNITYYFVVEFLTGNGNGINILSKEYIHMDNGGLHICTMEENEFRQFLTRKKMLHIRCTWTCKH